MDKLLMVLAALISQHRELRDNARQQHQNMETWYYTGSLDAYKEVLMLLTDEEVRSKMFREYCLFKERS